MFVEGGGDSWTLKRHWGWKWRRHGIKGRHGDGMLPKATRGVHSKNVEVSKKTLLQKCNNAILQYNSTLGSETLSLLQQVFTSSRWKEQGSELDDCWLYFWRRCPNSNVQRKGIMFSNNLNCTLFFYANTVMTKSKIEWDQAHNLKVRFSLYDVLITVLFNFQFKYSNLYCIVFILESVVWWNSVRNSDVRVFIVLKRFHDLDFASTIKLDARPANPCFQPSVRNILP